MFDPQNFIDFVCRYSIRREMALYYRSGRPIHAWRAYFWIREAGLPVPSWFLEYLDECAERLQKTTLGDAEDVAGAFGMGATGRHSTECRRLQAVQMVAGLKKPGERIEDIYKRVGKELGVSWTFVRNAWRDWGTKK